MAWRRKRKADEKAPATRKGQSWKKGVAGTGVEQPAGDDAATHGRDVEASAGSAANGAFFGCYLLSSLNPKKKGATYIGFTVNPARRLRQHNGELTSGAYRTKRMRPVEMVLVVYGFSSMVHALQFEWAWQHPTVSLAVKEAAAGIKNRAGVKGKIALLYAMLNLPKWNRLPLVVQFVGSRHVVHKLGLPPLPHHMDCVLAPLSSLRCKVDETAQDPPIQDPPTHPPATEPLDTPQENDNSDDDTEDPAPPSSSDAMSPPCSSCSDHAPLEQPVPQPGPSGWADPLSDWDWLDHDAPDCGSGPSPSGQQEQGRAADPFSTWQRLKARKQDPKAPTEKGSRQGSSSIGGTCRTAMLDSGPLVERGRQTGNGSCQDGAVSGRGESSWGGAKRTRQPDKCRAAEERDEAGESNVGADPNRPCGMRLSLLQRQLLERGRVGASSVRVASSVSQIDKIDLAGDDESHGQTIEKQSSQTVEQSRVGLEEECQPRSQGLSSLLGVELVILEDSPPPTMAKSHKERNQDGESLALPVAGHGGPHERRCLADQAAGRARAEGYSKETTWMRTKKMVIVLDP